MSKGANTNVKITFVYVKTSCKGDSGTFVLEPWPEHASAKAGDIMIIIMLFI